MRQSLLHVGLVPVAVLGLAASFALAQSPPPSPRPTPATAAVTPAVPAAPAQVTPVVTPAVPAAAPAPAQVIPAAALAVPLPAAAPVPSPVSGIRNKLSAADLPSAESILEVHREQHGEDGPWLAGLGWLARGALLVGDTAAARRYVGETRAAVQRRLVGRPLATDRDAEGSLGAAIEVEAQLLARQHGRDAAVELLRRELAVPETPPTFVFIDRQGVVRRYTPTRLSEAALEREVAALR